jgi:hypothetical protein
MPRYIKAGGNVAPEIRLEIGLIGSIFIPTSVLIFGFTSKANIHWIFPVIGAALYLPGIFLNFQSIVLYMTTAYPHYSASVLAGNDLFRSVMGCVFPYVDPRAFLFWRVVSDIVVSLDFLAGHSSTTLDLALARPCWLVFHFC